MTASELSGIDNPNLLIYVKNSSLAPSTINNVIVNGNASSIILTDVSSGNGNFYCPEPFNAMQIRYTRNFAQHTEVGVSCGWETIALPFTVQSITHDSQGTISPFGNSSTERHFWLRQMSDGNLVRATQIEANRPYIISMPNNPAYPSEFILSGNVVFSASNITVPMTSPVSISDNSSITFIPTFQRISQSSDIYALNVGESRSGYPEGSIFESGYRAIRPFDAYTRHGSPSGARKDYLTLESMLSMSMFCSTKPMKDRRFVRSGKCASSSRESSGRGSRGHGRLQTVPTALLG